MNKKLIVALILGACILAGISIAYLRHTPAYDESGRVPEHYLDRSEEIMEVVK